MLRVKAHARPAPASGEAKGAIDVGQRNGGRHQLLERKDVGVLAQESNGGIEVSWSVVVRAANRQTLTDDMFAADRVEQ